jgi:transcriptional regulator with XRE-family HTH domain
MTREKDEATLKKIEQLGNRLREIRKAKGYSNYENFAYEHNIPRPQYGRYERGEDLKFSSLLKVLKGFDMTLKEFFSEGFED